MFSFPLADTPAGSFDVPANSQVLLSNEEHSQQPEEHNHKETLKFITCFQIFLKTFIFYIFEKNFMFIICWFSTFLTLSIAIERYMAVCKPLKHRYAHSRDTGMHTHVTRQIQVNFTLDGIVGSDPNCTVHGFFFSKLEWRI